MKEVGYFPSIPVYNRSVTSWLSNLLSIFDQEWFVLNVEIQKKKIFMTKSLFKETKISI